MPSRLMFAALLCSALPAGAESETPRVFRGARILTAADVVWDPGTLVVSDGKITAIGLQDRIEIPKNSQVTDVRGRVIIPGLVDSHSHLGVYTRPGVPGNSDGNERTGPVQSVVRALDSLNPFDPGFRMATAGGVTTANVMPGSSNVIGGQTIYVKLRGNTPEQMRITSPDVLGGLKMANGENPKRYGSKGKAPGTRMKVAALQRAEFVRAGAYLEKWNRYRTKLAAGEDVPAPDVDITLEPLVEVLQKKRTVHFHTHRADDIMTALRLRQEFGFELLIQHGTEAYKVVDEIARHGVPVSMTVVDSPGGKAEVVDFIEECGAELFAAGVRVVVNTDDPITESRFFLRTAAIPVRGGLNADTALKSITLFPAQTMHLDERIGSLEPGKDADFVILSGEPFSIYTRVLETWIDGDKVFDLTDERQYQYQLGGFALTDQSHVPEAPPLIEAQKPPTRPDEPNADTAEVKDSNSVVVLAGRLYPGDARPIDNGVVLVQDGRIVGAGPRHAFRIPAGVPVVTAAAVTPGMIDAHSVVPLSGEYNIAADQDQDEKSDPNQSDVRVLDGFNPSEPLMQFLLQNGITIVHACPGRANVIGGMTGVFHTHGRTVESMTIRYPSAMLFNLGSAPKDTYGDRRPVTRMGTAALIREALSAAAGYARKRKSADQEKPPDRNLKLESLSMLLDGQVRAMFCAHRADDLLTALRLTREFKLNTMLAVATEAYLIPDEIIQAGVPVIVHPTMQRAGSSIETWNSYVANASVLSDQNIKIAISSGVEDYVPKSRVVRHEAAMAMVYGLGVDRAIRAVTLDAAEILGIDEHYGSLTEGKVADLVLYDGDPFEHTTHVTHVFVDGRLVYERAQRPTIPLAQRLRYSAAELPCCLGW